MGAKSVPLEVRFARKLLWKGDCLVWTGFTLPKGYGKIGLGGAGCASVLTHRLAYEMCKGPIPDGLLVRHTCDNPPCCNPDHLVVGTQKDNINDKVARNRQLRGDTDPKAKLTGISVREIIDMYATGSYTYKQLASQFGVSYSLVGQVIRGEIWTHITTKE